MSIVNNGILAKNDDGQLYWASDINFLMSNLYLDGDKDLNNHSESIGRKVVLNANPNDGRKILKEKTILPYLNKISSSYEDQRTDGIILNRNNIDYTNDEANTSFSYTASFKEYTNLVDFCDINGDGVLGIDDFLIILHCYAIIQTNKMSNPTMSYKTLIKDKILKYSSSNNAEVIPTTGTYVEREIFSINGTYPYAYTGAYNNEKDYYCAGFYKKKYKDLDENNFVFNLAVSLCLISYLLYPSNQDLLKQYYQIKYPEKIINLNDLYEIKEAIEIGLKESPTLLYNFSIDASLATKIDTLIVNNAEKGKSYIEIYIEKDYVSNSSNEFHVSNKNYSNLLMPQYARRVEVEDLDQNFWVISHLLDGLIQSLWQNGGIVDAINALIECNNNRNNVSNGNNSSIQQETLERINIDLNGEITDLNNNFLFENNKEYLYSNGFVRTINFSHLTEEGGFISSDYWVRVVFPKSSEINSVNDLMVNTEIKFLNPDIDLTSYNTIHLILTYDGLNLCCVVGGY